MRVFPLFLLFLLLISCRGEEKKEVKKGEAGNKLEGVRIVESRFGRKSFELNARKIIESEDTTYIYDFSVIFFGSESETLSSLRADSGIYVASSGNIVAMGDVKVISQDGTKIRGDELFYDESKKMIYSRRRVEIKRKGKTIVSEGFESDPSLRHIRLLGEVRGHE